MEASIMYVDELQSFVNKYEAAPIDVTIEGLKELVGQELIDEVFEFELVNEEGEVVDTVKNIDGKLIFNLVFDEIGIYKFTLREIVGDIDHIVYDDSEFEISVIVTDNLEGKLVARVQSQPLVFKNEYQSTPSIEVEKSAKLQSGAEKYTKVGDIIEYVVTATLWSPQVAYPGAKDFAEKYKAKNAIETLVYRGGDALSGWLSAALSALGMGLTGIALLAIPLSAAWCALCVWLARRQETLPSTHPAPPNFRRKNETHR